jgi:oligoribonuclease NrnB/cAMP/cGMP phosphodiesterase (DHH superfamily)
MICIYHSRDLDGWMSAAIVKLKYPDVELIGWDYGQPIPELNPEKESELIIADVSFAPEIMYRLNDAFNLIWCDHHKSALQDVYDFKVANNLKTILGNRNDKQAACELVWETLFAEYFPPSDDRNKPMPEIVRLLGRYDCFGHKGTDEEQAVLEFQYGARATISNPEEAFKKLSAIVNCPDPPQTTIMSTIMGNGRAIYKYLCTEAQQTYAKRFDVMYGFYKIACVNQERFNPINFGIDYHQDAYDVFMCFWWAKGKWMISIYNDNGKVDCSIIAKKFGGGGHNGASGFVTDDIEWLFEYRQ